MCVLLLEGTVFPSSPITDSAHLSSCYNLYQLDLPVDSTSTNAAAPTDQAIGSDKLLN